MAKREDTAIESVVSNHHAIPTPFDQPLSRHDLGMGFPQRDQHLHDPRLHFAADPVHFYGKRGRLNVNAPDYEVSLLRQLDWRGGKFRLDVGHVREIKHYGRFKATSWPISAHLLAGEALYDLPTYESDIGRNRQKIGKKSCSGPSAAGN